MTTTDLPLPTLGMTGTALVPRADEPQGRKDFASDQEVRWCPGCGDYAILAAMQGFLPELGLRRENIVFVSGIGCSSRFPYYLDTFGMHSIHGRAPAIATGLATSREDLSVWVVTGDGDALSIGGNHLIHAMRRNVNLKILLFNNRIYGLTKGQYSPTSEFGKVTKSTPLGSVDRPFNPVSLALGAEATFVGRALDSDRSQLTDVLTAAALHRGTALVEIYQNCPIFNDGAFEALKDSEQRDSLLLRLEEGRPLRFGRPGLDGMGSRGVFRDHGTGALRVADVTEDNVDDVVIHHPALEQSDQAFSISRLAESGADAVTPVGVFRAVDHPTYDDQARSQNTDARRRTTTSLQHLLQGNDTWTVPALDPEETDRSTTTGAG